jgi:hypothetical protein
MSDRWRDRRIKDFAHVSKYHIILEIEIVNLSWKIRDGYGDRDQKYQSRSTL